MPHATKSSTVGRRRSPQLISVLLSTYNMPAWLEKVLWGYAHQTHRDFEIVIADDGSSSQTSDLIGRVRDATRLPIQHVWHEDDGFRKCRILNRAIEAARGDYLLFSDGDCIPRADFVAQHHRAAAPRRFLSGGYYRLPSSISREISLEDIRSGRAFELSWLRKRGLAYSYRDLRLVRSGRAAALLDLLTPTRATWNGQNSSGWAGDIRAANGFDERMKYGGEDRELGERLENAGIRAKHVRFKAVCLHLHHDRGYVTYDDLVKNRAIRAETRKQRRRLTAYGIRRAA